MRCDSAFECCENIAVNASNLTVTLLNIRSLKNDAIDFAEESCFMECDMLCLTETQITIDQDNFNRKQTLNGFHVFNNSSEQTLLNITICFRKNVSLLSRNNLLVFPIFLFLKPNFTKNILRFLCFISAQTLPLL